MSNSVRPRPTPSPPTPRLIDKYMMGETLGKGGFSKVKLGLDPSTSPPTRVALKLLNKSSLSSSASHLRQAEREIAAMSAISHQHVLQLRDVRWSAKYTKKSGACYDVILLVLELATQGELFDYLSYTGAFHETLARTYFHQLIDAVGYCHSHAIAHRDLKPENLLLDHTFALKVADFGLSNSLITPAGQHRLMHTECGTLAYLAPEVLSRKGYDGTAADVWSCGVVLFIMIASFPPFQQPSLNDWWFNKLATGRAHLFWAAHTRSAAFSPALQRFLTSLLEVDPAKRMTIARMVEDEWFCGETLSTERLYEEMRKRREEVDVHKMRERAEKERKKRQDEEDRLRDDMTIRSLSDDEQLYRSRGADDGMDGQSTALPLITPAMALGTLRRGGPGGEEAESMRGLQQALHQLDADDARHPHASAVSFARASFASAKPKAKDEQLPPPPVYDPLLTLPTLTLLHSPLPLSQLHSRLSQLLTANHFQYTHQPTHHRYKAAINTPMGEVTLVIQLWTAAAADQQADSDEATVASDALGAAAVSRADGGYLLEFRRHSGDSGQYRELFRGLLVQMQAIVDPLSA